MRGDHKTSNRFPCNDPIWRIILSVGYTAEDYNWPFGWLGCWEFVPLRKRSLWCNLSSNTNSGESRVGLFLCALKWFTLLYWNVISTYTHCCISLGFQWELLGHKALLLFHHERDLTRKLYQVLWSYLYSHWEFPLFRKGPHDPLSPCQRKERWFSPLSLNDVRDASRRLVVVVIEVWSWPDACCSV